jgi:signal transduction histidine kinase
MDSRSSPKLKNIDFLAGGGEMGERMRALDWTQTPLGSPVNWPQSLKTIVRVMLDSRYAMWMLWGPDLTFFCNDAYLPTVGMKRDWVLGARSDKVWEEIWPDIGPRIERVLAEGRATWDEGLPLFLERYGFPEESYHTFSYSPIYDDSSRIAGMLCVVTEVTERVIGERRLRVLRDLAASPRAETIDEACKRLFSVLADDPLDIAFTALYLLDQSLERLQLVQHSGGLPDLLVPPIFASTESTDPWPIGEAIRSGVPQPAEIPPSIPIASSIWGDRVHEAMVLPVQHGSSSMSMAVLIVGVSPRRPLDDNYRGFFDLLVRQFAAAIADAQSYEAERARAEGLAEIDRAKTAFFSNVSHEFRTPLTLLLGPLEEALRKPADGLKGESLEGAHRNALRLLRLVNSLLDFSRIEAGRSQASYVPTNLAAATEDLASVFRSAIERAGLRYTVKCSALSQPIFVDRDMWEKIVLNLLSNAFKYTFEGEISVGLRDIDDFAELTVTDTGTGIPPEALPQLFDRFYRVPGAHGRTHEGSGIGLSLARELVKLHGGTIEVRSRLGAGTTFKVRIPVGFAHLPREHVAEETHRPQPPSNAQTFLEEAQRWLPDAQATEQQTGSFLALTRSEMPPSQTNPRNTAIILLVDDSRDMREYVRRLLEPRFQVILAEDGQHALELLDTGVQPDLVLSDVMMPRLDGFGLLKALRARPLIDNTPVIFLSARAGEEARIEGFDVGADDYLVKPFSARELITRIETHVRLSRQRREVDQRKDVFLATLAHELRNPLAPIRNAAQLLGSPKLEPKQLQWAQTVIQRQVKHMAWLLDDLLDIARITQGKLELKKQRITLSSVLDSAVETSRPLIDSKNHQFTVSLPPEPVMLNADALRLSQVISNLLTNAAKYTDAGGCICLTGNVENGILSLSIKDNGIGIPPESLKGIFVMFSQVTGAAERSEGGLGIGLALVSGLVSLHGGTVEAKSEGLGHGSEFIVKLPIDASIVATLETDTAPPEPIGRRILVADDNHDAADSLAMILERSGHDVRVVHDGRAALSVAETFRPDTVLLDIGMPELNGYDVARALRQKPWGAGMSLIALTGWGQDSDRQRAIDAGFDRHLTKPIDPDALQVILSDSTVRQAGSGPRQ